MEQELALTLGQFFSAQKKLAELGVISSRDYIGDIGRHLCRLVYGMAPPKERPAGYDGIIGDSRVAVRINNCPRGTPVRVAEPLDFDELIVILGPNCRLRPAGVVSDFIFYRLSPDEVRSRFQATQDGYEAGPSHFDRTYDRALNLAL
jgi:hypothetical protein